MASCYTPLRLRSNGSLLTGTARVEEIVERAVALGFPAVALTDANNLYLAIPFYKLARERGIKPILGAEIAHATGRATLLARNLAGYSNLCRILTRRNLDPAFDLAEAIARFADGLFVLTEDARLAESLATRMDPDTSGLFIELAAPGRAWFTWRDLAETARRLGVGVVATGDVYFLDADDYDLHRHLVAVRENKLVAEIDSEAAHPQSFLRTCDEMSAIFCDHPEALANTLRIAEECHLDIPMGKPIFPKYPLPPGETPYSYLYRRCLEGLPWRYGNGGTDIPVCPPMNGRQECLPHQRLTYELSLIDKQGFSEYFVIVGDIMRHARSKGIPTVGRGSGASSIVAYLLGITNVDPIKYKLPFERFLNPGRTDCPDLDVDLCWRLRDDVIRYVYETYGAERVAMISTHNCFRRRSAFRELAKACGIAPEVVNRISRRMDASCGTAALGCAEVLQDSDFVVSDATLGKILRYAERIEGFPHHLSIHCGGIVIADTTIDQYVPLEEAAKGIAITQYEMHAIEDVGLVKIDLLGNRALSTIRETVDIVKRETGETIDPDALPDDDAAALTLVREARTLGCCQLESPAMRHLLSMLRPDSIQRIIQALALIRPAPASIGMKETFVRRARGMEPTTFAHPALESVLGDTFGVMLYEDDAMLLAATLAGLSLAEGDRLRKAIKKSKDGDALDRVSRYFLKRARANGVPLDVAADIWAQMAKFNEYSFCRAHAAGYGLVAYQSAYLKAHHPAAYMTAAINNVQGIYPRRVHVWEAKRMGVAVLGPCVNRSGTEFTCEGGKIRVGLAQAKGISQATVESTLREREREPFRSLRDYMTRVRAGLVEIESLILVGAFDSVGQAFLPVCGSEREGRQECLPHHANARTRPELVYQARAMSGRLKGDRASGRLGGVERDVETPALPEFPLEERVNFELAILEIPLSAHPVALVKGERRNGFIAAIDLPQLLGKRVRALGALATTRGAPTKNGDIMQFVTLEDETGVFEVTLFPKVYSRVRRLLTDGGPYLVEGKVEDQYDSISVNAFRFERCGSKE